MDEDQIDAWTTTNLSDVQRLDNLGMRFLFVGPERMMPFVTFVSDDQYDAWSDCRQAGEAEGGLAAKVAHDRRGDHRADVAPEARDLPHEARGEVGVLDRGHEEDRVDLWRQL